MSITVLNREFDSVFSLNDSFLKGNENSVITYSCELNFDFNYKAVTDDSVELTDVNTLTLLQGNWANKGFVVGDEINIQAIYEEQSTGNNILIDYTGDIIDIIGDELIFSPDIQSTDLTPNLNPQGLLNTIFPSITGVALEVNNNTRSIPESLEFFFNLVENTAQGSPSSLIDGQVNRFRFLGVDAMVNGNTIFATQLGYKSGGAFGQNISLNLDTTSGSSVYTLTIPFYNWVRYLQAQPLTAPIAYNAQNSIKPYLKLQGFAQTNNPNAIIERIDNFQLGNVGWIDENYNQGVNNFTLTEFTNLDDDGNIIQGFDYGQPNNLTIKVQTTETTIDDKSIVLIQHLPIDGYKNNEKSFNQNTISAYSIAESTASVNSLSYDRDGAELDITSESISVSGNEITHTLRVVPNADYTTYFDSQVAGDKFIKITIQNQSDGFDDATVVVAFQGQADIQPPIGEEAEEVTAIDFYNHGMEAGVDDPIAGSVSALTEDDILCKSTMNFNKSDNYDAFKVMFRVVNNSNGAFFDLFSRTINLNQYPTTNDGKILINYSENLGYQLPNPERNVLSLEFNGNEDATTYEVELTHTLLLSWRYWQAKPQALADFLDFNLPNNGLNDEWVRYAQSGFSFIFRVELIKDGIADYFNAPQFFIDTYDSGSVTTAITYEDLDGNSIPAPLSNQQFVVIATHTAPSNWNAADMWGWIAQRPLENEPRRMNSTAWDYTNANLPLLPEQGETQSTLTVSGNVATVKTLCDGTQLPSNVTFVARIQSPIEQECILPLTWLFDTMETFGGTQKEKFEFFVQLARSGELSANGLCCADCNISESPNPIYKGMAFGSLNVTTNDLPIIWTAPFCCHDIYLGDGGCTATFNAQIDAIFAGIDGDLTAFEGLNVPTQANPFGGANWELLGQKIFNFTTDEALRYDMVSYFILNGIAIYCDPSGATIFQTLNVT